VGSKERREIPVSVLTRRELEGLLAGAPHQRLVVTPLLDKKRQVGDASIDVRLGNEFVLMRRRAFPHLDLAELDVLKARIATYQERLRIEYGESLVLHPNQLVLGSTLEYIKLPANVGAYVVGRSSWGRLGLVIATATAVAPGFAGCITLELSNLGEAPLVLYPGIRIAQLVLHSATSEVEYKGRYAYPTGPQFSRIYDDAELDFWCRTTAATEAGAGKPEEQARA
jgi:dCTP deaminase